METRVDRRLARIGLVVHPTRDVHVPLEAVLQWAQRSDVEVRQIEFGAEQRQIVPECSAPECDLVVAIGGDGTTLAAIHTAHRAGRPVLGVACGSLGALTTVAAADVAGALDRFAAGDWIKRDLPALTMNEDPDAPAFNDIVVIREGGGQVRIAAVLDGVLFARFAGDGCIVSTPIGSSAYTIAADGPLLAPGIDAFALTPLPTHGGFRPPLVIKAGSELLLEIAFGHGGARIEIDGQPHGLPGRSLTFRLQPSMATTVGFEDQEPFLTGLRRRGIISDSPRILVEDRRDGEHGNL